MAGFMGGMGGGGGPSASASATSRAGDISAGWIGGDVNLTTGNASAVNGGGLKTETLLIAGAIIIVGLLVWKKRSR